jgi:hypothetical protein
VFVNPDGRLKMNRDVVSFLGLCFIVYVFE